MFVYNYRAIWCVNAGLHKKLRPANAGVCKSCTHSVEAVLRYLIVDTDVAASEWT